MPLEELLIEGDGLDGVDRLAGSEPLDAIDQKQGIAVRQSLKNLLDVVGSGSPAGTFRCLVHLAHAAPPCWCNPWLSGLLAAGRPAGPAAAARLAAAPPAPRAEHAGPSLAAARSA